MLIRLVIFLKNYYRYFFSCISDGSIILFRCTKVSISRNQFVNYFCCRGNWASGLDLKGKAKTGVDDTATGELFQMRPYPSPGDILRMNAEGGGSKKKSKHT